MSVDDRPIRIGMVVNEASGDLLGAGLIKALRDRHHSIQVEGVGGPKMEAAGCRSLFPFEKFSVMGLAEVLRQLPELLRIRRSLKHYFIENPVDIFVGIDAPDFNLSLERKLKGAGIPSVHYVAPSVWAWRKWRVATIRKSVDLVLCLLPFELDFLAQHRIPALFVGHPMADEIPLHPDRNLAYQELGIKKEGPVVALLPGSRMSEVIRLAPLFLATAKLLFDKGLATGFLVPLVSDRIREYFAELLIRYAPDLPVEMVDGKSREVMLAADVVLTASGTATLEALLLKKPQVVAYRLHPLTYWLLRIFRVVKIKRYALANLLAQEEVAPEFIQHEATPQALSEAVEQLLVSDEQRAHIQTVSERVHRELKLNASERAAAGILALLERT